MEHGMLELTRRLARNAEGGDAADRLKGATPAVHRTRWRPLSAAAAWFTRTLHRFRESHELAGLGHRELRDMGTNRYEVHRELERPFWRC